MSALSRIIGANNDIHLALLEAPRDNSVGTAGIFPLRKKIRHETGRLGDKTGAFTPHSTAARKDTGGNVCAKSWVNFQQGEKVPRAGARPRLTRILAHLNPSDTSTHSCCLSHFVLRSARDAQRRRRFPQRAERLSALRHHSREFK